MGEIYYNRFPGDYLRDTGHLSLAAHGAYNLLLDTYYAKARPLPASVDALVRIVGAQGPAERKAVEEVAEEFFPVNGDGLRHNKRADVELARRAEFVADQARKGRLSAEAKRQQRFNSGSTAVEPEYQPDGVPKLNPPSPSPSSVPEPPPAALPPYPPTTSAAQQPPSAQERQPGPKGRTIEPDVWTGEVIAVDRMLDARLRRLYPQRFIAEQLPLADAKLATARLPNEDLSRQRSGAYLLTFLDRGWSEVKRNHREATYGDPKPYRPRKGLEAHEMTEEEFEEGARVAAQILRSLQYADAPRGEHEQAEEVTA